VHVGEDGLCGGVLCGPGVRSEIEINHDDRSPPWELAFHSYLSHDLTPRSFFLQLTDCSKAAFPNIVPTTITSDLMPLIIKSSRKKLSKM